jgi:hypothetical protein
MTEDEAKTKWCPMARAEAGRGEMSINRLPMGEPDVGCLCIASACMMWREASLPVKRDGDTFVFGGYCGLAK